MRGWLRAFGASVRALALATVVLGAGYAGFGLLVALAFPSQAAGSLVEADGSVVGSALLGQPVDGEQWFFGRPSAADQVAGVSAASNLGPNNADLVALIEQRRTEVAAREGVSPDQVPADAVTASASGLDPHISRDYAMLQVPRVAAAWGLTEDEVFAMVDEASSGALFGFWGESTVNVVLLNVALAQGQ